jgi:hypothetical protein
VRLIGSIVYMMGGGQGSNLISYDGANFVVPALATVTRLAVGGYDAGPTWGASFGGNPIASGRFFQRGNGSFHCWDAGDFTFSTVHNSASTLVQRDGSGQIAVAGLYMPVAAVGGGPTHVMGQGGDGLAHWYSASAIGPPLNAAALDFVGAVASGSQGGGATSTLTYSATENDLGVTNSSGNVTVPRAGQYAVALTCDWANGGGNTNDTVDLRLKANGGDIVVDSHVASAQGQPGRWAVVWKGFLAAGTVLSATIKNSFDNGSFGGGSSTLLVSFVPTAANP